VWQLGTNAAEIQQLHVLVHWGQRNRELVIRARAVPHVVAQLRLAIDTPTVIRLGDSLRVSFTALDPYGNEFAAPAPRTTVEDTTLGRVVSGTLIAGPKRGQTRLTVASEGARVTVPLSVMQKVASILPASDTLYFTSLGAAVPLRYTVRDDRGRLVADTAATVTLADTTVAQVADSSIRSSSPGATQVKLTIANATAVVGISVQQKVATLRLRRDTIRFDALLDTTTIYPVAQDSLGFPVAHPTLLLEVQDGSVVRVDSDLGLQAVQPGATTLILRDAVSGVTLTTPVVVQQRVATIDTRNMSFDALTDTATVMSVPRDRLGSVVGNAVLSYLSSDSSVATIDATGRVRSLSEGAVDVRITDQLSGTSSDAHVTVIQRAVILKLGVHAVTFDALRDSAHASFLALDRLGVPVRSAVAAFQSHDTAVATVTPDGLLESKNNGATIVVATSSDGPADTMSVTVAQQVAAVATHADTLEFSSLHATQDVPAVPIDRLGSIVADARLSVSSEDGTIASVDSLGRVHAEANGFARLLITSGGQSASMIVHVSQRPYRISMPDSVVFTAVGDSTVLSAQALDSLGSVVVGGIDSISIGDPSIAAASAGVFTARASGRTTAAVSVLGLIRTLAVVVDQIPATITAAVTDSEPVVKGAVGANFPLACRAFDHNGFPIDLAVQFLGSLRSTVVGSTCADARVSRSGYDTIAVALGAVVTRVPVIVATRPDSVGILAVGDTLPSTARIRYVGEDLSTPKVLALQPLVQQILAEYGDPTSNLDRARALRDWVARTAVHPHPPLHPNGSTANLGVLPAGATWNDINALTALPSKDSLLNANVQFWQSVGYDGYAMLDRLLGTLDASSGLRADDGMMVNRGGARYQIRDLHTYKYPICTFQAIMLNALWAAAGLQGMLSSTIDHDPAAVFIPEMGKWVYEDPTFNEEYQLDGTGEPLSPVELLTESLNGNASRLTVRKFAGPMTDPETYIPVESYVREHPNGMMIMGSQLNNRVVGIGGWSTRLVQISTPQLATAPLPYSNPRSYVPVTSNQAFPILAPAPVGISSQDSVYVVQLSSSFPSALIFQRRLNGATWENVASTDVLPVGQCVVEYRSQDGAGHTSAAARLDIWLPRSQEFVQQAVAGGVRGQAAYCVSPFN
jgi:hypothetical protein